MLPPTQGATWSARAENAEHPSATAFARRNAQIGILDTEPSVNELNLRRFCFRAHLFRRRPVETPRGIKNGTISRGCYCCASIPLARYMPFARLPFTGLAPRPLLLASRRKNRDAPLGQAF
jgi:hypothetical protein